MGTVASLLNPIGDAMMSPRFLTIAFLCLLSSTSVTIAQDVKRISVNGYELTYVEQGQGEPVVFVHGGMQDYRCGARNFHNSQRTITPSLTAVGTTILMW